MKTFNIRFRADLDLGINLEGNSKEEVLDKLYSMSVRELIEDGWVNNYEFDDFEQTVVEDHMELDVQVYDIEWDVDSGEESENLPREIKLEKLSVDNYDGEIEDYEIEEAIKDELADRYGYTVLEFKYDVVKVFD